MGKYKAIECDVCGMQVSGGYNHYSRFKRFRVSDDWYDRWAYGETLYVCDKCIREIGRRVRERAEVEIKVR